MAGSGMCTGGRVRHHLQHNLGREEFEYRVRRLRSRWNACARYYRRRQAGEHSSARISRFRARIYTINGFSAHADQAELLAWQKQTGANRTFLVHGEEDTMRQFAALLADTRVEMPGPIKFLNCKLMP